MNNVNREAKIVKVSIIGIIANLILVGFKAFVGFVSGAISIITDAINNLSDALSSIITIIGTKISTKKATKKHPYGYGQVEYLTSLIISVIILTTGITTIVESIKKIANPSEVNYDYISIIIVSAAIIVKILLGLYTRRKGKELNSDSLKGSGMDAIFDSLISTSTLIGIIISMAFNLSIEGYLGVLISAFILKAGIEILIDSIGAIIGKRIDSELSIKLKERISSFEGVYGTYDLILNRYGYHNIIGSVHIEVDDNKTAKEIHALTRKIQTAVYQEFGIIMTIGIYASNVENEEYAMIKNSIAKEIESYPTILQYHGFYVDGNINLVTFDLLFGFDEKNPESTKKEIEDKLKEMYPKYTFFANIDTDFSD